MTTTANVIQKVRKRNGNIVDFESSKITSAIWKALAATGINDSVVAVALTGKVVERLAKRNVTKECPSVEDVQDVVESVLIDEGYADTAKAFILYRHERRKVRDEKMKILQKDDLDEVDKAFDVNSLRVLEARYLLRDGEGKLIEGPKQLFERVAILVGINDVLHDSGIYKKFEGIAEVHTDWIKEAESYYAKIADFDQKFKIGKYYLNKYHFEALIRQYVRLVRKGEMKVGFKDLLRMIASNVFAQHEANIKEYYDVMVAKDFLPNTPTLMNAGAKLGQLSACFVLGMEDDMAQIMKSSTDAAMIFKSGGGVGINYSDLRQEGDIVASTSGVASGPVSFMNIIDTITDVVKQGGKRRGANMGILEVWHPDIEKFITAKTQPGVFENFNVSIGIWADFWQALVKGQKYNLHSPRDKGNDAKTIKQVDARQIMDTVALSAWKSAEPGVIFFDNINKYNPLIPARGGPLRATNPCGEQSLYPYESCNLGSINLANFVKEGQFDIERFAKVTRLTTRFLDNVVDMNKYPVPEIEEASIETRRIGLGIMGIADLLFRLGISYNSEKGYRLMNEIAETLSYISMQESIILAEERGAFDLFRETDYVKGKIPVAGVYENTDYKYDWAALTRRIMEKGIRNSWTTTIAPTGTLSMLADCSNGVEPVFALAFEKRVTVGSFLYTNKYLEAVLKQNGLYNDEILKKIANNYGSVRGLAEIPDWIQKTFVTAMDIHWTDHVLAQGIWQKWISNAIAKTINMPGDVTAEDVKCSYLLAHELGLKGVTVFRDGSRQEQVLHIIGENSHKKAFEVKPSSYVVTYVRETIKEPYVLEQLSKVFRVSAEEKKQKVEEYISNATESAMTVIQNPAVRMAQATMKPVVDDEKNKCPSCTAELINSGGCHICIDCGYSACHSG